MLVYYHWKKKLRVSKYIICGQCDLPGSNWQFGFQNGERKIVCQNLVKNFIKSDEIREIYETMEKDEDGCVEFEVCDETSFYFRVVDLSKNQNNK